MKTGNAPPQMVPCTTHECILAMEQEAKKAGVSSIADMPEETWRKMENRFELSILRGLEVP